ncbi:MAG: DUF1648 domain-containing protein [Bacteroidota bacterium]
MEKYRPKLDLPLSETERMLDRTTLSALALLILIPAFAYGNLPDQIPIHFNAKGEADDWANKLYIWLFPLIGLVTAAGLHLITKFPHTYNYPQTITPENVERQYRNGRTMIRLVNLFDSLLFAGLTYFIVRLAKQGEGQLPIWLMPLVLLATFALVAYSVYTAYQKE